MSVEGEVTIDLYRQMTDLQEKLRQSEAERIRLEEMFTVLVKTFREEEDMHLKSLENRYQTFLEDCAKRSYRNEKILRSVERVESGMNALHAKTERLKLLRSHYEAYLERITPTWRQPALLRYGSSPIRSTQEMEWSRRNRLVPEENVEFYQMNRLEYGPPSRPGKMYSSNPIITSEYFPNRLSEDEKQIKLFPSDRSRYDKNYWNDMTRETEEKGRYVYGYEKGFQGDGLQYLEPRSGIQSKTLTRKFEDEFVNKSAVRGLESALHHKLSLDHSPDLTKNLFHHEGGYKEGALSSKWDTVENPERESTCISPVRRDEKWFSDRRKEAMPRNFGAFDKSYIDDTPRMAREPVEIKKPEIIVGKHHPEASFKVDYFKRNSNFEGSSVESVKPEHALKSVNDSGLSKNGKKVEIDNMGSELEVRQPNPQAKWGLLKPTQTIGKLKEKLSFEEAQEPQCVEEEKHNGKFENLSLDQKSFEHSRKELDETDTSQSLSASWLPNGEKVPSPGLIVQASTIPDKPSSEEYRGDCENISESAYQDDFQQKHVDVCNEVYEDNEESYPESYYEQPPKSDYSRDIVSNVILEEDENEVNIQSDLPEGPVQNREGNNGYEQGKYHVGPEGDVQNDYSSYAVDGAVEVKENKEEYQDYQPKDPSQGYHNGEMYQANYSDMQPQEEYTFENQEITKYNTNNGLEYTTVEQYPRNGENQQYYESDEHGNYVPEGTGQGENFDNAYSQLQNYEDNSAAMVQYNQVDGTYQQEYVQEQNGNYYNQGEYDGYYQNQQGQNGQYLGNNEEENMGYTEATPYGNVQGDATTYGDGSNNLPLRQSNLSHLLESDSESFQMEHGSAAGNEDSDFDFSMSQQQ